jgi:hypothetical protein
MGRPLFTEMKANTSINRGLRWLYKQNLSWPAIVSIFIVIFVSIFYVVNVQSGHAWGDDFSMYIMHAENIAAGKPYAQTGYIFNPGIPGIGPKAYPPVYPLLLSPVIFQFGARIKLLKLVAIGCFCLFLFCFSTFSIKQINSWFQPILIFIIGFHPIFFSTSNAILSDIPFLLFCFLALIFSNQIVLDDIDFPKSKGDNIFLWFCSVLGILPTKNSSQTITPEKTRRIFTLKQIILSSITGIFLYLAYGTRSIGAILAVVLIIFSLLRSRRISLQTGMAIGLFIILALIQNVYIKGTESYFNSLPKSVGGFLSSFGLLTDYYLDLYTKIFTFGNRIFEIMLFTILLELSICGYIVQIKKGVKIYEIFVIIYIGALLMWPSRQGYRFLIPVLPFFFLYAFYGLQVLINFFKNRRFLKPILFAIVLLLTIFYYSDLYKRTFPLPISSDISAPVTKELFKFVKEETTSTEVIVFFKPRALALFTHRNSVLVTPYLPGDEVFESLKDFNTQYVIVRLNYPNDAQPAWIDFIAQRPQNFDRVFENEGFMMYKVKYPPN